MLILACAINVAFSCDDRLEEVSHDKKAISFQLNNACLSQVQLLPDNQLIGLNVGGRVVAFSNNKRENDIARYLNEKGNVIALYYAKNGILFSLLIPHQQDHHLQLIKIFQAPDALPTVIEVPLSSNLPVFKKQKKKIQYELYNNLNLIFNLQYLDAQIIPFENDYTAIVFRKFIVPTVLWIKENEIPIEQFLLPLPADDYDAQLRMNVAHFRASKKGESLLIALENSPSYFLLLKSFFKIDDKEPNSESHIIFKSNPSGLSFDHFKNFGQSAILVNDNNGAIFSASLEGNNIAIRTDSSDAQINISMNQSFPAKTSIRNLYRDLSDDIWLVGETGINQVTTGSILSGSEGFVARVSVSGSDVKVQKWHDYKQRRNFVTNIFDSPDGKYLLLIENASLTHQDDRQSILSLRKLRK
jgi:hypothetical protein